MNLMMDHWGYNHHNIQNILWSKLFSETHFVAFLGSHLIIYHSIIIPRKKNMSSQTIKEIFTKKLFRIVEYLKIV